MSFRFESNFGDWFKQFEQTVYGHAREAVERKGEELQAFFDDISECHHGRPADEVAEAIRLKDKGQFNFSDEQVDAYATAISDGRKVVVRVDTSDIPQR